MLQHICHTHSKYYFHTLFLSIIENWSTDYLKQLLNFKNTLCLISYSAINSTILNSTMIIFFDRCYILYDKQICILILQIYRVVYKLIKTILNMHFYKNVTIICVYRHLIKKSLYRECSKSQIQRVV